MKTEKNRTAKKLYEWLWFIITLAPFIICLFTAFNDSFFNQVSLEEALDIYLDFIMANFTGGANSIITDVLDNVIYMTNEIGDPLFTYSRMVVVFGVHLITVEVVRLVIDLILWVPRFLQKQLNKGVK